MLDFKFHAARIRERLLRADGVVITEEGILFDELTILHDAVLEFAALHCDFEINGVATRLAEELRSFKFTNRAMFASSSLQPLAVTGLPPAESLASTTASSATTESSNAIQNLKA